MKKAKQPSAKAQERREQLILNSISAKELRTKFIENAKNLEDALFYSECSVNYMLLNYILPSEGVEEFKTLKQWNEESFSIIKGSISYTIWGKPRKGVNKEQNPKEGEDPKEQEYKFFPICLMFSNLQVKPKGEETPEIEIVANPEVLSVVLDSVVKETQPIEQSEKIEETEEEQSAEMLERIENYKAKREAKADRYRELADKNKDLSNSAFKSSREMVECIPMGQPILVGHHSERGHRNLLDRSWNTLGKAVKLDEKSLYYAGKAKSVENNRAIFSDDPEAIKKLKDKLINLELSRKTMKAANVIIRKKGFNDVQKVEELQKLNFTEKQAIEILRPDFGNRVGFAPYVFSNLSGNIRTVKQRIQKLETTASEETTERELNGVKIVENVEDNRLQLFFDGKPSDEVRTDLKRNGFKWSRYNGCWQRHRSRWATSQAEELINNI
jgi:hypothetical protein